MILVEKILAFLIFIFSSSLILAEEKKAEKGHDSHASAPADKAPAEKAPEEDPNLPIRIDRNFVPFPAPLVMKLKTREESKIEVHPGFATLVLFTSSWCVECQEIAPLVKALKKKYEFLGLRVVYAYSKDTPKDSIGSASEFGILDTSVLISDEAIKSFLSPELPSISLSDRQGWLSFRKAKVKREDLVELDRKLSLMFAF